MACTFMTQTKLTVYKWDFVTGYELPCISLLLWGVSASAALWKLEWAVLYAKAKVTLCTIPLTQDSGCTLSTTHACSIKKLLYTWLHVCTIDTQSLPNLQHIKELRTKVVVYPRIIGMGNCPKSWVYLLSFMRYFDLVNFTFVLLSLREGKLLFIWLDYWFSAF